MGTNSRGVASAGPSARYGRRDLGPLVVFVVLFVLGVMIGAPAVAQTPPYGVMVNDLGSWSELGSRMDVVKAVNGSWIRIDAPWAWVEGSRDSFSWTYLDSVVQNAGARNLRIVATLWGTPSWAGPSTYGPPTDLSRWDNFVSHVAARYRGYGIIWEIWNEPDKWYWAGTPAQYAQLLARAYAKIKAADPGATVALGGLAQGGSNLVADFLQRILGDPTYPAGRYFDLHNIHTSFRTPSGIVSQISSNRTILAQYGASKPIIVTEASYPSDPAYQTLPNYVGGGESTQARYLVDAYKAMIANGIGVITWATGVDYTSNVGAYTTTGLTHTNYSAKAAYTSFRNMASASTGAPGSVSNFVVSDPGTGGRLNLSWTNPADSDLAGVLILRRAGAAVTETPVTGATYSGNQTVGSSVVVFVGPGTSFANIGLTNGTTYYYKAFAYDTARNYASGASGSGTPHLSGSTAPSTCASSVVMDNLPPGQSDGLHSFTGTWAASSITPYNGPNPSLYNSSSATAESYTWKTSTLSSTQTCKYSVYVWWTAYSNRTSAAPYTVSGHTAGSVTRSFDQRTNGSQWILHGTYTFAPGTSGTVRLGQGPGGYTIADGVRFVLTP